MDDLSKHYQLLGLKPGASPEEMKQAYRDLVKVWHPDRFLHDDRMRALAQDKLKEINGAYEMLKAQAFQDSIAPEPTAARETETTAAASSPARHRTAPWAALGVLAFLVMAGAAILFFGNGDGNKTTAAPPTNAVVAASSLSATNARFALKFNLNKGHLAIATTGALTGTFTVECWALTHRPKQIGTIVSSCAPNDFSFNLKFRQGKRFHADIGDGSRWIAKLANATFAYERDTWYHVAYVVTSDKYRIYVNGKQVATKEIYPAGNPMLYDDKHHLWLGADGGAAPDDLDGRIAEVRIWRTARTQTQIESNLNETLTGDEPGLVGCWRFAEGAGTTTADSSGHGFTGTLVGAVSWSKETPPNFGH